MSLGSDHECADTDLDVRYSITVNQNKSVVAAIEAIGEATWTPIDYTLGGEASVAECPYGDGHRLVVRRTRFCATQAELFPSWPTTPSSPIAQGVRSTSMPTTAAMPWSSSPSGT